LQVRRSEVPHFADLAAFDHLLRQRNRRHAAVIEVHHVHDAGLPHRIEHLARLLQVQSQRLLAIHVLARLRGGHAHLIMQAAGRGDVDDVDILAFAQLPPIGFVALPAETLSKLDRLVGVPAADGLHHGRRIRVKKLAHLQIGIGMGLAHKLRTDQTDIDSPGRHVTPSCVLWLRVTKYETAKDAKCAKKAKRPDVFTWRSWRSWRFNSFCSSHIVLATPYSVPRPRSASQVARKPNAWAIY
jgi:hypothetical protein